MLDSSMTEYGQSGLSFSSATEQQRARRQPRMGRRHTTPDLGRRRCSISQLQHTIACQKEGNRATDVCDAAQSLMYHKSLMVTPCKARIRMGRRWTETKHLQIRQSISSDSALAHAQMHPTNLDLPWRHNGGSLTSDSSLRSIKEQKLLRSVSPEGASELPAAWFVKSPSASGRCSENESSPFCSQSPSSYWSPSSSSAPTPRGNNSINGCCNGGLLNTSKANRTAFSKKSLFTSPGKSKDHIQPVHSALDYGGKGCNRHAKRISPFSDNTVYSGAEGLFEEKVGNSVPTYYGRYNGYADSYESKDDETNNLVDNIKAATNGDIGRRLMKSCESSVCSTPSLISTSCNSFSAFPAMEIINKASSLSSGSRSSSSEGLAVVQIEGKNNVDDRFRSPSVVLGSLLSIRVEDFNNGHVYHEALRDKLRTIFGLSRLRAQTPCDSEHDSSVTSLEFRSPHQNTKELFHHRLRRVLAFSDEHEIGYSLGTKFCARRCRNLRSKSVPVGVHDFIQSQKNCELGSLRAIEMESHSCSSGALLCHERTIPDDISPASSELFIDSDSIVDYQLGFRDSPPQSPPIISSTSSASVHIDIRKDRMKTQTANVSINSNDSSAKQHCDASSQPVREGPIEQFQIHSKRNSCTKRCYRSGKPKSSRDECPPVQSPLSDRGINVLPCDDHCLYGALDQEPMFLTSKFEGLCKIHSNQMLARKTCLNTTAINPFTSLSTEDCCTSEKW